MNAPQQVGEIERDLDAAARAVVPDGPPSDIWSRGRRRRGTRQLAAGAGIAAAVIALVLPAIAVAGLLPGQGDRAADVAGAPGAEPAGLPDKLYALPSDAPRERAPGPLAAAYQVYADSESGREQIVGVTRRDGRTVALSGVPVPAGQPLGSPTMALSPDGGLIAYIRGGQLEIPRSGRDPGVEELVVRDLRTGDEIVADLPPGAAEDLGNVRSLSFSGGLVLVSLDRIPAQSLHAVDPSTGDTTTLASGNPFMWAGVPSAEPIFTVGRSVYTGTAPAQGREPAYRAYRGRSANRAALSPDGERLAVITSDLYDGTPPDPTRLMVAEIGPAGAVDSQPPVQDGTRIETWLPAGLVLRLPQRSASQEYTEVEEQAWLIVDPDRPSDRERRVIDISEIAPDGIVVAADLLAAPVRDAVDPSPFPLAVVAAAVTAAAAGATFIVMRRRRRDAER